MFDDADDLAERRRELHATSRRLHGPRSEPAHLELGRLAAWCEQNEIRADVYGDGPDLAAFESRVAELLGHERARFMPSGTMAQQIAARVWCERIGVPRIAMHPSCHMELHEQRGYRRLHGLDAVLVGDFERPLVAGDLASAAESVSMLVVELPTRENGGKLAPWDDVVDLCEAAREQDVITHLDGARLWEAAVGYERPLDEIAALFDSVYVSFYKGIGALPGAMLLGPPDFIEEATLWQRRHGGNLFNSMPNWASAAMRLDEQIAKMPAYRQRAVELAAALSTVDGVTIEPPVPQVNMFHVYLQGEREDLLVARDRIATERGLWLFGGLQATGVPEMWRFEIAVGDAAMDADLTEVVAGFGDVLEARS